MDEWTPTPEQSDVIMAFALADVIEYKGKSDSNSIFKRIMGPRPDLRPNAGVPVPALKNEI